MRRRWSGLERFFEEAAAAGVVTLVEVDPGQRVGGAGRVRHGAARILGVGKGYVEVLPGLHHNVGEVLLATG